MLPEGPIGVGVIGLGRAGREMHVQELSLCHGFRIAAGCDQLAERTQRLADEFGASPYSDHRELLADPNVELAVVATRQDTHVAIAIEALRAGKHVVIEKPMGLNVAEAESVVAVAVETGRLVLPRHNRRWDHDFQHVCEVMQSGILGEVFYIRLCRHNYNRRDDWQTLKRFGGGLLNNWGPHLIDHALQFLKERPAIAFSELKHVVSAGDAEDHVRITLKGSGNMTVDIEVSGGVALGEPWYRVMGSLGTLVCSGGESTLKYLDPAELSPIAAHEGTPPEDAGFGRSRPLPWHEETHVAEPASPMPSFYECAYRTIRQGEPFPVTPEDALNVTWVIEEARKGSTF